MICHFLQEKDALFSSEEHGGLSWARWNKPGTILISIEWQVHDRSKQWTNVKMNQGEKEGKSETHLQATEVALYHRNPSYAIQWRQLRHAQQNILPWSDQRSHKRTSQSFLVSLIFPQHYKNPKLWNCFNTLNPNSCIFPNMISCLEWRIYNSSRWTESESLLHGGERVLCTVMLRGLHFKARI